ncbi:MAG: hypothetical protein JRE64_03975 [Deltaproteobacteria bacterium]|nr:hypothetical protein [Deltaproteobacteria bacterium]
MNRIRQLLFQDKPDWVGHRIATFMAGNPTLLLTSSYLLISGLGLLYEFVLFTQFGVNVLDYSEAADFFLAAFKRPEALFSSCAIIATLVFYRVIANYARKQKNKALRIILLFFSWVGLFRRKILIPFGMIYFFFFYGMAAQSEAQRIVFRSNEIAIISTRFGAPSEYQIIPIGATERFIFGVQWSEEFDSLRQTDDYTEIKPLVTAVPFTNIVKIEYRHASISGRGRPSNQAN